MFLPSSFSNGALLESPRFSRRSRGTQAVPQLLWATAIVLVAVGGVAAMFGMLAPLATDIDSVVPVMVAQERASATGVRAAAATLEGVERDVSTGTLSTRRVHASLVTAPRATVFYSNREKYMKATARTLQILPLVSGGTLEASQREARSSNACSGGNCNTRNCRRYPPSVAEPSP